MYDYMGPFIQAEKKIQESVILLSPFFFDKSIKEVEIQKKKACLCM